MYAVYYSGMEWFSRALELITAVAIVFAVLQLVGDRAQRHREFENLYVQRYWSLLDRMSDELYSGSGNESKEDARTIIAYLRLCEDEIDLRQQGFVSDQTWKIWAWGITEQMEQKPYRDQLKLMAADELTSLRKFLVDGKDPLEWGWLKRWWSGLH